MNFSRRILGLFVSIVAFGLLAGCSSSSSGTPNAPAAITLSTTAVTFPGTPAATTSSAITVTVTNSGGSSLTISSATISGTNASAFAISQNSCTTVASNSSCSISVTFDPPSVSTYQAQLNIADNVTGSPQIVTLSGTGTAFGISLSATALAFPNTDVGVTSAGMSTTVTNTGTATLTISGVTISGTGFSQSNNCGSSVAPNATCVITVTFTPAAQTSYTGSVSIADNVSGSPQIVTLTGTGGAPGITISPTALSAGLILAGSVAPMTLTVTNSGTGPLTVSGTSITGTNAGSFSVTANTCSTPVVAGSYCQMIVTFSPTTTGSSFAATLNLTDNVTGSPQTVALAGSAKAEPNSCSSTNGTTSPLQTAPTTNYAGRTFNGTVMAGSLPVMGASVQIYAAGTTGNGSAPTSLYSTTTSSTGAFTVPASFTCPYSNSVLYAVSTGGKVGTNTTANAGLVLASVLGMCNSLSGTQTFTINEVTTAATAWSMAQFMSAGGKIGASSYNSIGANNTPGIVLAAGTFANLVNPLTGTAPGTYFPATGTAPTAKINSLANLLNTCAASNGNTSTACTQLYNNTVTNSTTNDTLDAAMFLVQYPGNNVSALYTLSANSTAYTPALTAAPMDWTLFVTFSGGGMTDPSAISVDSTGRVWVANYFSIASLFSNTGSPAFASGISGNNLENSYGGGVDVNDQMWVTNEQSTYGINTGLGSVTLLNSSGSSPATYGSGGLDFPIAVSFDTSALSWIVDYGNSHLTILNNAGTVQSGATGYTSAQYIFPVAIAVDSKCNAYVTNQSSNTITFTSADGSTFGSYVTGSGPSGIAIDGTNNIWVANYYGNSIGLVTSTGTVASGSNGFTGGGIDHPQGIAVDGKGTVWVANYRSNTGLSSVLSELAGASASSPGTLLSPSTGWGGDAGMVEPFAVAIDASGNLWVTNFGTNTLTEFVGLAVPVQTPLLGPIRVP